MLNLPLVLLLAAVVCFTVALLIALAVFTGGNFDAWLTGGLLAWAVSVLVGAAPWRTAPPQ